MKKMWRDSCTISRWRYQVARCFSGVARFENQGARYKNQEPRRLLSGNTLSVNMTLSGRFSDRLFMSRYSLFTVTLITLALFIGSCNSDVKTAEDQQQYTCSMHPEIVKDEPGSCPICGMDLTPIRGQHQDTHSADSLLDIGSDKDRDSETMVVGESSNAPEITLSGSVTYNTNLIKSISARVSGRIEKSYVKYTFERVKKGQLLLKVYSPELVAIQQELLFLKSKGDTDLLNKTKSKLSLLGVSAQQISSILKTGKADYTVNIYSKYSGYLINPETDNDSALQTTNSPLNIREGQYINSGDLLFKVFNNNSLWAEFYTSASGSEWLKSGSAISFTIGNKSMDSKVNFVQPIFKNNQNFKVIRVVLNNQNHQYKIGELASATLKHSNMKGIWIPQQAVYQSGEKNIIFIKTSNGLEAKEVQISAKAKEQILVKNGLTVGDEIAKNASYLKDSESFINSK